MEGANEALLREVNELISQALLKLKDIGPVPQLEEDYDYDSRARIGKARPPVLGEDGEVDEEQTRWQDPIVDTEVKLAVIKELLTKATTDDNGIYMLEKYYTSTCY